MNFIYVTKAVWKQIPNLFLDFEWNKKAKDREIDGALPKITHSGWDEAHKWRFTWIALVEYKVEEYMVLLVVIFECDHVSVQLAVRVNLKPQQVDENATHRVYNSSFSVSHSQILSDKLKTLSRDSHLS